MPKASLITVDRPPRIQPELPIEEIEIPAPPEKPDQGWSRLVQVGSPLVTIIGYILVGTLGGVGRNPWYILPMALSVVASVAFSVYTYFNDKKKLAEIMRAYDDKLVELSKEMHGYHNMQRRFHEYNYPDFRVINRVVKNARLEAGKPDRTLRSETRLWERRTDDDDFGMIRLGVGTLPSTVVYTLEKIENFDDPQVRAALKLQEDSRFVHDIPVVVSLRPPVDDDDAVEDEEDEEREEKEVQYARIPNSHSLGIAGDAGQVYRFSRAMLAEFCTFHAPADAQVYVLGSNRNEWNWLESLPHSQGGEHDNLTCFVQEFNQTKQASVLDEGRQGELERFLEGIRKTLAQRRIRLEDRDEQSSGSDPTLPFMLVVVDLLEAAYDQDSPLNLDALESEAAISLLLGGGAALGAAVIFLVPERSKVPGDCKAVIEIERTTPATNSRVEQVRQLHFRYAEVGVNSFRYVGQADFVYTPEEMHALVAQLAELRIREGFGSGLAGAVPFMGLMGYSSLDHLKSMAWQTWQASIKPEHAGYLRAKIGLMAGNKPRSLVFSAKQDGVHGMIAGSTGSGKSELMISMIIAMVVTYDPSVLNFVLVDYKGGGAFGDFKNLPHCVDIITNLTGDAVTRMFTAIQSEMQRRQVLNKETGTKNIVDYREKGYHQSYQPYPFLFIIIDEFAEMIADRPEYKGQLESITRLGRAQGVHLLLAAQRPSGVTDQMRSNIKFRICLRVETPGESREMLRRSEAAFLPSDIPGRGYLQVGNEEIELIQVSYTGEKYREPVYDRHAPVIWPKRPKLQEAQDQDAPELFKVIVDALDNMASEYNVPEQHAPWPDFLPPRLALTGLLISPNPNAVTITSEIYLEGSDQIMLGHEPEANLTLNPALNAWLNGESGWYDTFDWERYAIRPVIGLVDNPYAAKQVPLTINLPRGHLAIFGASGWGKSVAIRTLLVSLMATHSPDAVHVYVLDLGGRNFGVLEKYPHVGAVIIPDAEGYRERVEQLLRELDNIVEERKTILSNTNIADVYQYNLRHPSDALPVMVVAIDNFLEFQETFTNKKEDVPDAMGKLVELARQAKPYGLHFIISATTPAILSNQLYNLFTERITLKLSDTTEYRTVIGGAVADVPDVPGRGYARIGHLPLSVQVAQLFVEPDEEQSDSGSEAELLSRIAETMQQEITASGREYNLPLRVDPLPKAVLFKQILARQMEAPLGKGFLPRLIKTTELHWKNSLDGELADWLAVTIGVISGNRLREMHFEAKKDGVHGLIAGGTGSGKSELLMTLIVGLALRYDPSVLNFVLVDYKGGGAFKPFSELPHCVDIITNLDKSGVNRMFTAINAEMQRRQQLNAETQTKDIVDYRKKGLHLSHTPYPHLFIIIDEYAEMITQNPEFRDELDSITRVGRAQGVNLLLAAQRPTGVTDQMRANIKFRICLRVEQPETSREMLRRTDAAYLPNGMPGRGFLQIGNDNIELTQIAYTGEVYQETGIEPDEGGQLPRFYDLVVDISKRLHQTDPPRTPWPPALARQLTLDTPVPQAYLEEEARLYLTHNRPGARLTVNPFVQSWLAEDGTAPPAWPGVAWHKTAMRAVAGLVDDPYNARLLPLLVDFAKGHVVLFGASGYGKTTFLRTLIISLAATHSPDEFQTHIMGGQNLEALKALPHVGTIILPDERGYEERVQQILRELNDIIDERKRYFSESGASTLYEYNSDTDHPFPAILVAIDNFAEFLETFGEGSKKDSEDNLLDAFVALVRQGKAYGLHVVITVPRPNNLTNKLYSLFTERYTLRLADSGDYQAVVGSGRVEPNEVAGRGLTKVERQTLEFQIAVAVGNFDEQGQLRNEVPQIRRMGERMHQLGRWSGQKPLRIEALPKASSYRQVLSEVFSLNPDVSFLTGLKQAMAEKWAVTGSAEEADWLTVTMGIASGSRHRTLHLSAKTDGVHGMIAGGTGSGKSELLMTMIIGLVANFSPDILNLVLVDYKGGGAFRPFETLPHCVDIVTNLNKAAVNRMFTSINAEIRRRQGLNAETGTKDIIDYRKKGLHLTHEAYPHLFIIIDEYAEMIDDNPEYRQELESITRVGRAQGINLILASQRPKGVTDQMRANIKLRLCLRVEQIETSREMLRRPDAAFLPNGVPGRGYLQVGNENLELLQISWTGESQPDDRPAAVVWPGRSSNEDAQTEAEDVPRLYDAVVTLSSELYNGQMAPKPWPGFLPELFSLQSTLTDAQHNQTFTLLPSVTNWLNSDTAALWPAPVWDETAMRPVVGLVDNPMEASQIPLNLNLSRSHLAIFGDTGWGKTSLLRTIVVSLAATHSPNDLHIYVLDLGGRAYRSLEALPHMGAVIYADEEAYEERLQRLFDRLQKMAETRQQTFSNAGVNTLYEYNQTHPDERVPAVLVIIDNFAELQENYETLVESTVMPLVRRSVGLGISFVVSANIPNNMSSKMFNLFGERITFRQSNVDRYMDIVGRGAIALDEIAGLGYIRIGRYPLMFQSATPVGIFDAGGRPLYPEADELQLLAKNMTTYIEQGDFVWQTKPEPIQILPTMVPLHKMLKAAGPPPTTRRITAILGQSSNLEPTLIDLKRMGPHFVIVGPPLSGKTTTLYNWILSLATRYTPEQAGFILIDLDRRFVEYGGKQTLADLPHVMETITTLDVMETLPARLKEECGILAQQEPPREIFVFIDNFDDFSDEVERERDLVRDLATLAGRFGRDGLHFVISVNATSGSRSSELWRRIQSSNYGIALRTEQALQGPLQVTRTPPAVRGKELPIGRGFLVRSSQPTMLQVATPYEVPAASVVAAQADPDDEEAVVAAALDDWVKQLQRHYPDQQAAWTAVEAGSAAAATVPGAALDPNLLRMLGLLRRYALQEIKAGNGTESTVAQQLLATDMAQWSNTEALLPLVKEVWVQVAGGGMEISREIAKDMAVDDLMMGIENAMSEAEETSSE
jgi:S-DNA-T family DNA segregation ATPase FtsK/SpoIIIE